MDDRLLLFPWFFGIFYSSIPLFWFAIHPLARRWSRMRRSPYIILLPVWAFVTGALGLATWPWHSLQLYSPFHARWWMIAAIVAAGILFSIGGRIYARIGMDFGLRNFSGANELRPQEHEQKVVITGLHGRMRHPIYFAHLAMMAGWAVLSGLLLNFVLLAIATFCSFPLMIWMEERELEKRFGKSYREYKSNVPVIPRFFQVHKYEKSTG